MMYEPQPEQDEQRQMIQQEPPLEQRLSAYYGPLLKEQPLAQTVWQDLQRKLGPQPRARNHGAWKHLLRRRKRQLVPEYVRSAFIHVAYEARMVHSLPALQCAFKPGATPAVYVPWHLKPSIRLTLPSSMTEIDGAILDTLLATGLARQRLSVRWFILFRQVLCLCPALLSLLLLFFLKWPYLVLGIVLMVPLFALSWALSNRLRRYVCLSADELAVLWLGRERICQGLHGLADYHQRVATRARLGRRERPKNPGIHRRRVRSGRGSEWSVPSLEERIERVCSVHSAIYDERLTLVR